MARNLSRQLLHRSGTHSNDVPKPAHNPPDATTTTAGKEAIILPSRELVIQRMNEVIQETPELRRELVAQLRQALAVGSLVLDSQTLADKLIGLQLNDMRSAA